MTMLEPGALAALASRVQVPRYDRSAVTVGVVHIGVGGFHRAHQALYLDDVLAGGDLAWGICGVGLMPADVAARDAAAAQGGLYTLMTVDPDGALTSRVIGSLVQYLYGPDDPEAVLNVLADPATRIVSLTITEGGYGVNDATGLFAPQDSATLADIEQGGPPRSALGYLTEGLRRRREAGIPAFAVLSCDNIQGNGHVARVALTSFASRRDADLADWIGREVAFPSSMVDRITPVPDDATRELARKVLGIDDAWPVRSESFRQWVVEDSFSHGRPDFAAAGVQLVEDVEPYEHMKLRLLNGSHQVMAHVGLLAGFTWVHDACRDPLVVALLRRYMQTEAIPTLGPVPGIELGAYCDQLLERFASEQVQDTLARQVVDSSARVPKFLLPVVAEQLRLGGPIDCCAVVLAAWSLRLERAVAPAPDPQHDALLAATLNEQGTPGAMLDVASVFGDLGANPRLRSAYVEARIALGARGAMAVLAALV
ncbi:mannitol dehydrogenase family protein [Cellulomonas sp. KRMCY2]|uniref:mannitol dehydrogenase family protein n=1 Tax=Cellulomonas sp. KRMCY2 TaxID=1304865 RepID=UPI00045E8A17|nr:mannitol dehydrogenase family protein [Cellulomonas sp. KRMCY2]